MPDSVVLESWFLERVPPGETRAWFERALQAARLGPGPGFELAWSGCGRRLGRAPVELTADEAAALGARGAVVIPSGWGHDELGRALLLRAAATAQPAAAPALVDDLFRKGEMREQQAVLRILPHLPEPRQYAGIAADAVRINVLTVIEAIACDNPYPAAFMLELAFNQLVMKALFNGLPLARVRGLAERNNPELRRMVAAYASERRAAGRPVPGDVSLILGGSNDAPV